VEEAASVVTTVWVQPPHRWLSKAFSVTVREDSSLSRDHYLMLGGVSVEFLLYRYVDSKLWLSPGNSLGGEPPTCVLTMLIG
jgi:hypothetical protein